MRARGIAIAELCERTVLGNAGVSEFVVCNAKKNAANIKMLLIDD